ncbi:MAG TPA: FimV/HubP family polar landmark protein [Burkholderiales bacterium]|jgi:FimV-like protein|nr:FimV/HubP family polar landmark protein [Burkholderiales bacterium]
MTGKAQASILGAALIAAVLFAPDLRAQAAAKKAAEPVIYTVGKGETIITIANKVRYPKATENQMVYAIVRRNPNAFSVRTKERLLPGAKLTIPDEATVLSYKAALADREVASLRKGEALYQDGLASEKKGDMKIAVKAYIDSARLGHPLADLRLGELYDRDNSKTLPRDLQESISHYQKAREFGVDVKEQKPRDVGSPGVPTH